MTVDLEVFKTRRVVPLRFERATRGNPSPLRPDLDDRGHRPDEFGPVVSVMQGQNIHVRLRRMLLDHGAPLFVTSSEESHVTIVDPADGALPGGETTDIQLHGVSGGGATANASELEVRFGAADGPIVSRLTVWCFQPRRLRVTPHIVTIAQTGGGAAAVTSGADVDAIMTIASRIWWPYGISFNVGPIQHDTIQQATAGILSDTDDDLRTLLTTNWVPNTINAYFVPQIGTGPVLGYGISRPSSVTFNTTNPGIILADRNAHGDAPDAMWSGNDLAHEIGHFLEMWHPGHREPPNVREDTWCRRMLMHNHNLMGVYAGWRNDVGYGTHLGQGRRGCLVTMKSVPGITTDAECTTARGAIVSGPY